MSQDVKAIVIACNTATSACVDYLRQRYPIDIIGMEPALKVACEMGPHQKIAVWATDYTLKEKKFAHLMQRFEKEHSIYRIPCPKLVELVEQDALNQEALIHSTLDAYLKQAPEVDSIVLGCTHFVFYKKALRQWIDPSISIVDGNEGTARHLKDLLAQKDLLASAGGSIQWNNTKEDQISLSKKLWKRLEEENVTCME